jgi:hypothetical protein
MRKGRLLAALSVAGAVALQVSPGHSKPGTLPPQVCADAGGMIDVAGGVLDLNVTVLDPAGRFARWIGDSMACTIPGCEVVQASGPFELDDTSAVLPLTEHWQFHFGQIIQGCYTVRIEAVEADTAHLDLNRSTGGENGPWKIANAEAGARLSEGEIAVWTLDWGCRAGVDSVWCTLKRSKSSPRPTHNAQKM